MKVILVLDAQVHTYNVYLIVEIWTSLPVVFRKPHNNESYVQEFLREQKILEPKSIKIKGPTRQFQIVLDAGEVLLN